MLFKFSSSAFFVVSLALFLGSPQTQAQQQSSSCVASAASFVDKMGIEDLPIYLTTVPGSGVSAALKIFAGANDRLMFESHISGGFFVGNQAARDYIQQVCFGNSTITVILTNNKTYQFTVSTQGQQNYYQTMGQTLKLVEAGNFQSMLAHITPPAAAAKVPRLGGQ